MVRRATGFWHDFREFLNRGNVIDLAVAVVMGTAFGKIVTSFVEDIITPAILTPAMQATGAANLTELVIPGTRIKYGSFLAAIIDFLVISLVVFLVIRAYEKFKRRFMHQDAVETAEVDAVAVQQQLADAANRLAAAIEARRL